MQINLGVKIKYMKIVEGFDGDAEEQFVHAPITTRSAWEITKGNVKSILDKQIDELATKLDIRSNRGNKETSWAKMAYTNH